MVIAIDLDRLTALTDENERLRRDMYLTQARTNGQVALALVRAGQAELARRCAKASASAAHIAMTAIAS